MKHAPQFPTIAEALQRVFFPTLQSRASWSPDSRSSRRLNSILFQRRGLTNGQAGRNFGPGGRFGPPIKGHSRPIDEAIRSYNVRVVNSDGTLHDAERLYDVLSRMDRQKFFLVQMGNPDELGTIPVCKIIDKHLFRQSEQAKAKPIKSPEQTKKQVDFNWTIDQNDLDHRLRRMRTFLEEGRKVEVELKRKKRTKQVDRKEMETLISKIRQGVAGVEGVRENKEMIWHKIEIMLQGKPHIDWGATMFWESKAMEERAKQKNKEKRKERGEEKAEN